MDETWKFAIIIVVNLLLFAGANWGLQKEREIKQAYWTGKVEQKLDNLCTRVTKLEDRIFNGGGKA